MYTHTHSFQTARTDNPQIQQSFLYQGNNPWLGMEEREGGCTHLIFLATQLLNSVSHLSFLLWSCLVLLIHPYALLLTSACWKSNSTNARLVALAPSLALDPTFGIHSHKTLDTAQPFHLLKPNWKKLPLLTVFSPQLIPIPSFCYSEWVCVCAYVCVRACVRLRSRACTLACLHIRVIHDFIAVCVCSI